MVTMMAMTCSSSSSTSKPVAQFETSSKSFYSLFYFLAHTDTFVQAKRLLYAFENDNAFVFVSIPEMSQFAHTATATQLTHSLGRLARTHSHLLRTTVHLDLLAISLSYRPLLLSQPMPNCLFWLILILWWRINIHIW